MLDITAIARRNGYSTADINAGTEFFRRKSRMTNPPGEFDRKGRFTAAERTEAVRGCRTPSAAWPFPEMKAARTANHCAEIFDAKALHVKRIAKALGIEKTARESGGITAHRLLTLAAAVEKVLKKVVQ